MILILLLCCVAVALWLRPRAVTAPEPAGTLTWAASPEVDPAFLDGFPASPDPPPDSLGPSASA